MCAVRKRRYIIIAAVNGAALAAFVILYFIFSNITGKLSSQQAAERWDINGEQRSAQLSAFFSDSGAIDLNTVYTMRANIDKKLNENSVEALSSGARTWIDAYSSEDTLTITSSREDYTINLEVYVTATGGDYFIFHPLTLLSGYYYSDDDLMQDRLVIDETSAWQLFGSSNVDGMTVLISGKRFYIAGVISPDSDKASVYTAGDKPRVYMSYAAFNALKGTDEKDVGITSYEAIIPSPVTGLANQILTEVISTDKSNVRIVENSSRYSIKNMLSLAFDGGKSAVVDSAVVYPFWENAARITERQASAVAAWAAGILIIPLVTVIYLILLLYINRKSVSDKLVKKIKAVSYNVSNEIKLKKQKT